jgi:hypothetical protein
MTWPMQLGLLRLSAILVSNLANQRLVHAPATTGLRISRSGSHRGVVVSEDADPRS